MATYKEVQQVRKKKHYVQYYNPNKFIPEFDPPVEVDQVYKDEFVLVQKEDVDTRLRVTKLVNETLRTHRFSDCNTYRSLEYYFKDANVPNYMYDYLKRIYTWDNGMNDDTFKNLANACANIDFAVLSTEVLYAENLQDIWDVIRDLSLQANAAALDGLFIGLFDIVRSRGETHKGVFKQNKKAEKKIVELYKRTIFGDKHHEPITIFDDPSMPWSTVVSLSKHINSFKNKYEELSENELIEKVIKPFEKIIESDLSLIDIGEYDI